MQRNLHASVGIQFAANGNLASSSESGSELLRVSLQGARQHLGNFLGELKDATAKQFKRLYQQLLVIVAHKLVPKQPNRIELRVKKRRPKAYPRMQEPRAQLKAKLAA